MSRVVDTLVTKYDRPIKRPSRQMMRGELCEGRSTLEYDVLLDGVPVTDNCFCADESASYVVVTERLPGGGFAVEPDKPFLKLHLKRGDVLIRHQSERAD